MIEFEKLWFDTETYSEVPIEHGTYKYAENAEVMTYQYAIDDGPAYVIDLTEGHPIDLELLEYLLNSAEIVEAHNAMFDRNVLRLGNLKIDIPIKKWRCSMVKALAHGLPGSLDKLCGILNVPQDLAKVKDGRRLIHLFCKPRPKNMKLRRATRESHPLDWEMFLEYGRMDIPSMRAVSNLLPSWNYGEVGAGAKERDLWFLDQEMNDRGVPIDLDLVQAAIRATDDEQARLKKRVQVATRDQVDAATQRDKLIEFIFAEYGIGLADMTKATITKMLDRDDLDPELVELLRMRQQASKSSTAKYKTFANAVNKDGKLRGMIQFDGASRTRRDAGRKPQLQNLASRGLLKQKQIEIGIEAMLAGCEEIVFDDVMLLTASTIRSVIVPGAGKKLVVPDLANIEGRGLAWEAGEEWKLQAFRDYDTLLGADGKWHTGPEIYDAILRREPIEIPLDDEGEPTRFGPDLYKLAYAKAMRIAVGEVTKDERKIGKVMELGLGYMGGIHAFVTFALVYQLDLEEMAKRAWDAIPNDMILEATDFVAWLEDKGGSWPMSRKAVIVCESFKRMWRAAHPKTVALAKNMEENWVLATENPGETFKYGKFQFRRDNAWTRIKLPSGRFLCYPHPKVEGGELSFLGLNQYSHQWGRVKTYTGKLAENATQSTARDFMFDALYGIAGAGYDLVFRVHDETPAVAPDRPEFNIDHMCALLAKPPDWAPDMPLAAAGFEGYRYRKD